MNIIKNFTLRSMRHNKKWTIVTIIGIIISTAMLTAVSTLTYSFMSFMQRSVIEDTGEWHVGYENIKPEQIPILEDDPLTETIMLSRNIGFTQFSQPKNPDKPYLFIQQYDASALQEFPVHLIDGRMPSNDQELLIPRHLETNGGVPYKIGDQLTLEIGNRYTDDGQQLSDNSSLMYLVNPEDGTREISETYIPEYTRTFTVVGVIERLPSERFSVAGYAAVTYLDPAALTSEQTVNASIGVNHLSKKIYPHSRALAEKLGIPDQINYNTELLRYHGMLENDNTQEIVYSFVLIIIVIIMIASVSLIYNAFAISVSERIRQLGMLASIGATKGQKRENVYFEGLIVGLIGIPLGILAGIAGIAVTLHFVAPLLKSTMPNIESTISLVVSPASIAVSTAFAILTIFISVYIPAKRASNIMPIDAIRQSQEIKLTSKAIKTSRLTQKLFGIEGELALKNLKRSKKKYRATIFSLTISLILFLTVSTMAEYTTSSADIRLNITNINYDALVRLYNVQPEAQQQLFEQITALDSVTDSAFARQIDVDFYADEDQLPDLTKQLLAKGSDGKYKLNDTLLVALDDQSLAKYASSIGASSVDFHDTDQQNVIVVNRGVTYSSAERKFIEGQPLKAAAGDKLNIWEKIWNDTSGTTTTTELASAEVTIGAITDRLPLGSITAPVQSMLLVTSNDVLDAVVQTLEDQFADVTGTITVHPNIVVKAIDGELLDQQIDTVLQNSHLDRNNYYYSNIIIQAKQEKNILTTMGVFLYGFITLISLICIANIFNTVSTNIALRRKEFAMLRSVGMTPGSFNKMVRFESIFYGLKALTYGLPISVAIAYYLYTTLNEQISFGFRLPWTEYAIAILCVFIIVGITMLYSSARIKKENIIDALKDETM